MSGQESVAWIGLGSNVGDPVGQVRAALVSIDAIPRTRVYLQSSLFASEPMGPPDQPLYINAVAAVRTRLTPHALLRALHDIEHEAGRVREGKRWGPRRLDLDLLDFDERTVADEELTLPHPGAGQRSFVLVPWAELAPDTWIPGAGRVGDLAPTRASDVWLYRDEAK